MLVRLVCPSCCSSSPRRGRCSSCRSCCCWRCWCCGSPPALMAPSRREGLLILQIPVIGVSTVCSTSSLCLGGGRHRKMMRKRKQKKWTLLAFGLFYITPKMTVLVTVEPIFIKYRIILKLLRKQLIRTLSWIVLLYVFYTRTRMYRYATTPPPGYVIDSEWQKRRFVDGESQTEGTCRLKIGKFQIDIVFFINFNFKSFLEKESALGTPRHLRQGSCILSILFLADFSHFSGIPLPVIEP